MTWRNDNTTTCNTLNISVRRAYVMSMSPANVSRLHAFKSGITPNEGPPST
jgi:hypothetical protein